MTMFTPDQVRQSMRLYAITDDSWLHGRSIADCVADALAGGATCVQLREKQGCTPKAADTARALRGLCRQAGVPFIVNDYVGLAREVDADGVHVGQEDMACEGARRLLGPGKIVGVSVGTCEEALAAQAAGADYLGAGAVFPTPTKPESVALGIEALKAICSAVSIPVVAVGGMGLETIPQLAGTGVSGIAVVSAIFAQDDIIGATKGLYKATKALW